MSALIAMRPVIIQIMLGFMIAGSALCAFSTARAADIGPPARLLAAAEAGDPQAQYELGRLYERGEGVRRDDAIALRWFRNAALQGHAQAALDFGWMLASGYGTAKNLEKAYRWILRAGRMGAPGAEDLKLAYGRDLDPEIRHAIEAEIAAEIRSAPEGNDNATVVNPPVKLRHLGNIKELRRRYNAGEGALVLPQIEEIAQNGNPIAQNLLGVALFRSIEPAVRAEAVPWFYKAARQGLVAAQYNLATAQLAGAAGRIDPVSASQWLDLAENGLPQGQTTDYALITQRFRERAEYTDPYRAAIQGYASAQDELRQMIEAKRQEVRARLELDRRLGGG